MDQVNYIEPVRYTVEDDGKFIQENIIPRCFLYIALHKQEEIPKRVVSFPDFDVTVPLSRGEFDRGR